MKKIMFNDKFGLTQAVLEGRKTMTRRIIKGKSFWERCPEGMWTSDEIKAWEKECDERLINLYQTEEWEKAKEWALSYIANYKIGEIVAVAQSYKDAGFSENTLLYHADKDHGGYRMVKAVNEIGWTNKMFVAANLMPYQIKITDIKIERLQDISDEDCLKEGVAKLPQGAPFDGFFIRDELHYSNLCYDTPREAFANLIDKVSGKGIWDSNPCCFCYEFQIVNEK